MFQRFTLLALLLTYGVSSFGQASIKPAAGNKVLNVAPTPPPPPKPIPPTKKLNDKMEYVFIQDKPTSLKPKEGDLIRVHMMSSCNNRMMYNSAQTNKNKPVEFSVNKPGFKGDIINAIMLMTPGDSLICLVDADELFKNMKKPMPEFIKKGDKMVYNIRLVSIKTAAELQKEQQAKFQKQMQEQMAKKQKEMQKQIVIDDKKLQAYFTKNNLKPTKSPTGLYYIINQEGSGESPKNNYKVKMNYTGRLLDGTVFDSNTDTTFKHVTPFEFTMGARQVISGWDEGVSYLKKGSKATFYIPSSLAYGNTAQPGNPNNKKGIPANSPLTFDVELVDMTPPVNEDEAIQKYFKDKGITGATKTATGMYYLITKEGTGDLPKAGETMVMNYTGYHLNGDKFDSNVDSTFNHVSPFEFALGKGSVIKGWDEGVALLKKGSKATFFIPSALGYGAQGRPKIPANSTLLFDVELVDIKK